MNPLIDQLRQVVGANQVLVDGDLTAWEQDWRKRSRGKALAVVRPGSASEVAQVVRLCAAAGTAIVPQGGNTGLVVGSTPDESGTQVVLALQRLNAVRALDPANLTVTVEAGCVLQRVQEASEAAGFLFPLSLAAEGSCTIGGNLATNAGGTQVLRYGNSRDLFIGSEGTLGVITAATMKLYPLPVARLTAWAAVPRLEEAVRLLGLAHRQLGAGLTGFEVMGQFALSLVARHFSQLRVPLYQQAPYCVLLENSDDESEVHARGQFEKLLELALEQGCVTDAVVAENLGQANQLWHVRESIPLAQAEEGLNIKHDISVPVSRIPEFCRETDRLLQQLIPGVRLVNFGHLGDGNLHYNVQAPRESDPIGFLEQWEDKVNSLVYDSVQRFDGSISAEHGVGSLKLAKLEQHKSPVALELMRAIKRALDPHNVMNPGRVLRA